jgi:uncharacterized protein YbbC (DUF1343 family)
MIRVLTGLDRLVTDNELQRSFKGTVGLLCHNASIDRSCVGAVDRFYQIFGDRFTAIFGPQHGVKSADQDNMVETFHKVHPTLHIPVYSLYSETRVASDAMLEGLDHLFIDLQDIGCRTYSYLSTLTLMLEKCSGEDLELIVLDRPNPIDGLTVEGPLLEPEFRSFIGRHPIPMRHGLTLGELARMHQRYWTTATCQLQVIGMEGWERLMHFQDTGLPWALPSPNISRPETCLIYPGTVLFEGTSASEGRGTVQPFEVIGIPSLEPHSFLQEILMEEISIPGLKGCVLRPLYFKPTFDKHANIECGGFQIHVTDRHRFAPWKTGMLLLGMLFKFHWELIEWRDPPFEYNDTQLPIDLLNGSSKPRQWVEEASLELDFLEVSNSEFREKSLEIRLY